MTEMTRNERLLSVGQVADLEGEGKKISAPQLKYIHERKTSALLCCSVRLGGMSANCSAAQLKALPEKARKVLDATFGADQVMERWAWLHKPEVQELITDMMKAAEQATGTLAQMLATARPSERDLVGPNAANAVRSSSKE